MTRYWTCPCGTRNERVKQKCVNPDCKRSRPKKRVPKHAQTLRDDSYAEYARLNELIHGAGETCGVCRKPPKDTRNLDRDHGHDRSENSYGRPRGLACPGDWGCNKLMAKLTLAKARQIVAYLERVETYYALDMEDVA